MRAESVKKIYDGYSSVYDFLFSGIFFPRIKSAISSMDIEPGDNILDVGVGTGLSLPVYPDFCKVTGIDLSDQMLGKARNKAKKLGLSNIQLQQMDAMNIEFPDNSFDKVFLSHVVSVVPDPRKTIDEVKRVCKPGGNIVIVNHFQSPNKFVAKIEDFITPVCKRLGWRTDLSLADLLRESGLRVAKTYKIKKIDFWSIVFAYNDK
ncbi:MAG: methyltransferase domain-containing protein [Thermodesulfobacteriota bacterium]